MIERDCEPLADIWSQGYVQGHTGLVPDDLMALRTRENFFDRLQAFSGESVVAFDSQDIHSGFGLIKENEIYQFYVARTGQGTDLATRLMQETTQHIRNAGHTVAWLHVTPGNARATAFYEKFGFQNQGVHTAMVDTSTGPFAVDCAVMEMQLN